MDNIKVKILKLKPFLKKNYTDIDIDRLVVFGFSILEKNKIPLYFDYIAVALFRMFPLKFSMANFRQYPDTYRISNSTRRLAGSLKSKKDAPWVTGRAEVGFTLTDTGKEIADQVAALIENPGGTKKIAPKHIRSRGRSPRQDVEEIKSSTTYIKWESDPQKLTAYDIYSLLGAVPYAPKELLKKHLVYLQDSAKMLADKKIVQFLGWIMEKFPNIFN